MKLDLTGNFVDLEGKDTENKMGQTLAHMLASSPKGDPIKFYDWAMSLFRVGEIEIDESDRKTLEKFINDSGASVAIKGQLLKVLDSIKEKK